ncbi:hypothetical protein M569_03128, partial [Genlisea aurea]
MEANIQTEIHEAQDLRAYSSSRQSISSLQSKIPSNHYPKEVFFGDFGSKSGVPGSRGPYSGGLTASYREISDEDARLVFINDPLRTNEKLEYPVNKIRTTKYSVLSFLPRNLYEQFHRVAYLYFLVIAILNQLPQLAVFGRGVSVLPLAFVVLVTAVKDAYEDYRRYRSDKVENCRLSLVLSDGRFDPKPWKHIRVGEVIKVSRNETIPCDMVLLSTHDPTGVAYVQTTNLDGESNLKTRYARQETQMMNPEEEEEKMTGLIIKCEKPNRNIYGFNGNIVFDEKHVSLGPSNIILRGCELKNTSWAIGVAVYCGKDTKVMLNNSGAPSKRSRLETRMNREIIYLSIALVCLCVVVCTCYGVWLKQHDDELSLMQFFSKTDYSETPVGKYDYYGIGMETFFSFLMSVIVFQIMIPISLYISMELVRLGQAYFMTRDRSMFDESSNTWFQCRALNINEDLGQIKYVFSDKTGTLTENKMEFRCASVGGVDYSNGMMQSIEDSKTGYSVTDDGVILRPKVSVKVDSELLEICKRGDKSIVHDFFLGLSACNTIVPIIVETSDPSLRLIEYQGESPDEQALAYAAAAYGFMLVERTSGHIVIDIQGRRQRFDVLGMHEFDSNRKRMSVVLGCPDKKIGVFAKGADTTMFSVAHTKPSDDSNIVGATQDHLHAYSSKGLRTLVIGKRMLSGAEFEEWRSAYEIANKALMGRATLLKNVAFNLENNLTILGASGIEDKLQQGVPEAIESLRVAGIKVWVLTGDKQETAISIGYSSKLLTRKMTQIIINNHSKESCRKSLDDSLLLCKKLGVVSDSPPPPDGNANEIALIIDGTSLVHILDTELEEKVFFF